MTIYALLIYMITWLLPLIWTFPCKCLNTVPSYKTLYFHLYYLGSLSDHQLCWKKAVNFEWSELWSGRWHPTTRWCLHLAAPLPRHHQPWSKTNTLSLQHSDTVSRFFFSVYIFFTPPSLRWLQSYPGPTQNTQPNLPFPVRETVAGAPCAKLRSTNSFRTY